MHHFNNRVLSRIVVHTSYMVPGIEPAYSFGYYYTSTILTDYLVC